MTSTEPVAGAWYPKTGSERQLVRSQVERMVSDGRFSASKRYPHLLQYIVEQTLAGNEDNLKERTIGVEVFHRPPDYDTNLDPVVRLCAAEVRKRLAQYYQSPAHAGELRIELNPGSYIPVFSQPAPDALALEVIPADVSSKAEQVSQPKETRKIYWLAGLIVSGAIIAAILVLGTRYWRQPGQTKVRSRRSLVSVAHQQQAYLVLYWRNRVVSSPHDSPLTELQSVADDDSISSGVGGQERLCSFFRRSDS